MKKKLLIPIMVVVLLIGVVGGTMAWLTDRTASKVNTFTVGNINITLTEKTGEEYKMIPGTTMNKDPKVTVAADSEDCYLFVKVKEAGGNITVTENDVQSTKSFDDFITYSVIDEWTLLDVETTDGSKVYYRIVMANDIKREFSVIRDANGTANKVTVKDTVTKEMMDELTKDSSKAPTLTFTAYAVQLHDGTDRNGNPTDFTVEGGLAADKLVSRHDHINPNHNYVGTIIKDIFI